MKVVETSLPGLLIIEPRVFPDSRGFFVETYQRERYQSELRPSSCRITCHFRRKDYYAVCTVRVRMHRENWCRCCRERFGTWQWISVENRCISADGQQWN